MSFGHSAETIRRARQLRQANNVAEGALWNVLKSRLLSGHKFVRQYPIGPYFADFVHRRTRLVIEIDGCQHVDSAHDQVRDRYMQQRGYAILRFWSHNVIRQRGAVCDTILAAIEGKIADDMVSFDVKFLRAWPSPPAAPAPLPHGGRGQ